MEYLILREKENIRNVLLRLREGELSNDKLLCIGILESALRDIVHVEVIPDQWPTYQALVIRPRRTKLVPNVDGYDLWYIMSASDTWRLEWLLRQPAVIDWKSEFFVTALSDRLRATFETVGKEFGGELVVTLKTSTVYMTEAAHALVNRMPTLPDGFYFDKARDDELEFMARKRFSTIYFRARTEALRYQLRHLHHVVIRNCRHEIVAFNTQRIIGSQAIGWTRDDCRGHGLFFLSRMATSVLNKPMKLSGYGHVQVGNQAAAASMAKQGLEVTGSETWLLHKPNKLVSCL